MYPHLIGYNPEFWFKIVNKACATVNIVTESAKLGGVIGYLNLAISSVNRAILLCAMMWKINTSGFGKLSSVALEFQFRRTKKR